MPEQPWFQIAEYDSADGIRDSIAARFPMLADPGLTPLVVVGAGPEGERLIRTCLEHGIPILELLDEDPAMSGSQVHGFRVKPINHLDHADSLATGSAAAIIASNRPLNSARYLRSLGAVSVAPFALLQVIHSSLFPPHVFYERWCEVLFDDRYLYRDLAARLSDESSVRALAAIVRFRMTFDVEVLAEVLTPNPYLASDLVRLEKGSRCIDCGAYDGDSVAALLSQFDQEVTEVVAFEPHPVTFQDLYARFKHDARVKLEEVAVADFTGVHAMSDEPARGSQLLSNSDTLVRTGTIDNFLSGQQVHYIKMNIEGSEPQALIGAQRSIKEWRPTLAVGAYHAPDHLTRIPQIIHEMNPEYDLFLRQEGGGFVETVLYALQPQSYAL